jgi:AraC-like DNA-binding protein
MALARRFDYLGLAALAAMAGYSDQPQVTRECRRISGLTPSELLAGEAPDWHGPASVVDVRIVQEGTPGVAQSWVA